MKSVPHVAGVHKTLETLGVVGQSSQSVEQVSRRVFLRGSVGLCGLLVESLGDKRIEAAAQRGLGQDLSGRAEVSDGDSAHCV